MMKLLLLLLAVVSGYKFKIVGFTPRQRRVLDDAIRTYNDILGPVFTIDRNAKYTIVNKHIDGHFGLTDWAYTPTEVVDITVMIDIDRLYYTNCVYNVLLHELGHVLNMGHSTVKGSIMNMSIVSLHGRALPMRRARLNTYDLRQLLC